MRRIKKRKHTQKRMMSWRYYLAAMVVLGGICLGFWVSPWGVYCRTQVSALWHTILEKSYLNLGQIVLEGHQRTTKEDINHALSLMQGTPILDVDLKKVRNSLLALPWVKDVSVERYLPNTLRLVFTEKTPIALWQYNKRYLPLDEEGQPIQDPKAVVSNVLLVVGQDAPEHTPDLIEALESFPDIRVRVRSAVRVGNRRWTLVLNDAENGLKIYLPEEGMKKALARLESQKELLKRDLDMIDLRLEDRLLVRSKTLTQKRKEAQ